MSLGTWTHPLDASAPMLDGWFVPWIAMRPSPVPKWVSTSEWPESPKAIGPYGWFAPDVGTRSRTKNRPVGVGRSGAPIPTGLVSRTAPSPTRRSRSSWAEREISTRTVGAFTVTEAAGTQAVDPFGRVGSSTSNHPGWRLSVRNVSGEPSSLVAGST